MTLDTLFSLSNLLVTPFWALMILLPTWRWTKRIIGSPFIAVPIALIYAVLVIPNALDLLITLSNPTLPVVRDLLGTPEGATIAWAHFLAFDLLVGRWAYLDSRERNINPFLMAPVLLFTFMLGPVGFLLYLALRPLSSSKQPQTSSASA